MVAFTDKIIKLLQSCNKNTLTHQNRIQWCISVNHEILAHSSSASLFHDVKLWESMQDVPLKEPDCRKIFSN